MNDASQEAFGEPVAYMGEGGTIPFMGMLGDKFPKTQFVITGVLGPHSNAHGPNEFSAHSNGQEGHGRDRADDRGALHAEEEVELGLLSPDRGRGWVRGRRTPFNPLT